MNERELRTRLLELDAAATPGPWFGFISAAIREARKMARQLADIEALPRDWNEEAGDFVVNAQALDRILRGNEP